MKHNRGRLGVAFALLWVAGWTFLVGAAPCDPSPYGILSGRGRGWLDGTNGKPDAYANATTAGVKWVQLFVRWYILQPNGPTDLATATDPLWDAPQIDPGDDQAAWCKSTGCQGAESLINEAVAAGLSVNVQVWGTPNWAKEQGCVNGGNNCAPCLPGECNDPTITTPPFQQFMQKMAAHFGDRVGGWTLWTEPDLNNYWKGDPGKWRNRIIAPGYDGVRAANAYVLVGTGGLVSPTTTDLNNWHLDNNTNALVRPVSFVGADVLEGTINDWNNEVDVVNNWAGSNGTKIWITGGGCASQVCNCDGCSLQCGCYETFNGQTRRRIIQNLKHLHCAAPNVTRVFWARLHDATGACNHPPPGSIQCSLGLLKEDGTKRAFTYNGAVESPYNDLQAAIADTTCP